MVFSAVLTSDASISVTVGGVALPAKWKNKPSGGVGVYHGSVAYGSNRGAVKISISRSGKTIASFTGTDITTNCRDGYTNWNAWVGLERLSLIWNSNAYYPPRTHGGLATHLIRRGTMTITYPDDNAKLYNGEVKKETFGVGARVDVPAGKRHEVWIGDEGCEYVIGE
ncbi:hypothetical protein BDW68DRAFT_183505 [Aspergillus falconensis]